MSCMPNSNCIHIRTYISNILLPHIIHARMSPTETEQRKNRLSTLSTLPNDGILAEIMMKNGQKKA